VLQSARPLGTEIEIVLEMACSAVIDPRRSPADRRLPPGCIVYRRIQGDMHRLCVQRGPRLIGLSRLVSLAHVRRGAEAEED